MILVRHFDKLNTTQAHQPQLGMRIAELMLIFNF